MRSIPPFMITDDLRNGRRLSLDALGGRSGCPYRITAQTISTAVGKGQPPALRSLSGLISESRFGLTADRFTGIDSCRFSMLRMYIRARHLLRSARTQRGDGATGRRVARNRPPRRHKSNKRGRSVFKEILLPIDLANPETQSKALAAALGHAEAFGSRTACPSRYCRTWEAAS